MVGSCATGVVGLSMPVSLSEVWLVKFRIALSPFLNLHFSVTAYLGYVSNCRRLSQQSSSTIRWKRLNLFCFVCRTQSTLHHEWSPLDFVSFTMIDSSSNYCSLIVTDFFVCWFCSYAHSDQQKYSQFTVETWCVFNQASRRDGSERERSHVHFLVNR